jgi:hypothetical protein
MATCPLCGITLNSTDLTFNKVRSFSGTTSNDGVCASCILKSPRYTNER